MIKIISLSLFIIFLSNCSFQVPKNDWKRKSSNAFNSYKKNFLQANDALAKNDLSRAIAHAKQSANLTQLATIYLGECALNISVGQPNTCANYKKIAPFINNHALDSYYHLLTNTLLEDEVNSLPKQYQKFAISTLEEDFNMANINIQNIKLESSSFLCAALIKDNMSAVSREHIITLSSYHGYKKVVLFWLEESKRMAFDDEERNEISAKISILKSHQ